MAIIDDYGAIARRLREIQPHAGTNDTPKDWRSLAEETARAYVESRRKGPIADIIRSRAKAIIPRRRSAS